MVGVQSFVACCRCCYLCESVCLYVCAFGMFVLCARGMVSGQVWLGGQGVTTRAFTPDNHVSFVYLFP